jgi:general secretion pathway protein D
MKPGIRVAPLLALMIIGGCTHAPTASISPGHIDADAANGPAKGAIPQPVQTTVALPKPKPTAKTETYSVVVNNVPVHDLLFALARDAKLNVDVHPGLNGLVTLNAIDQTLPQLLGRIAKQVDMRWEMDGSNLTVMPDKPFLRTYQIDFLNMSRSVKSTISTSTQIASAQSGTGSGSGSSGSGSSQSGTQGGNTATTAVTSDTKNDLMESLISNVSDMLKEEDKLRYRLAVETEAGIQASTQGTGRIAGDMSSGKKTETLTPLSQKSETAGPGISASGSGSQTTDARAEAKKKIGEYEAAVSVFANKESGVLFVRATSRQHEKVQQFIDQVMRTSRRQVLIEATIAEVTLSDGYKQGIDWSTGPLGGKGFTITQKGTAGLATTNPLNILTLAYNNATSRFGNISAEVDLLQSFGNVRVLSSPKLSVMNNQTATLKVADAKVYFTVKADTVITNNSVGSQTFTTTANAVSVGFFMTVTPQINDADEVTLNVRPTVTRIIGYVNDPNPTLAAVGVVNKVPEIQTREMESIIRVPSGQIAVMGGLMQDEISDLTDAVPLVSAIPIVGEFFKHRNDGSKKTELVVFLRPVVIKDASLNGDFASFRSELPKDDFFTRKEMPAYKTGTTGAPR